MLDAWYMDDDTTMDQREEHRLKPNKPATLEDLQTLGVLHWTFDADSYKDSPEFAVRVDARNVRTWTAKGWHRVSELNRYCRCSHCI